MTRVVYTAAAESDLTRIGDAIAADDPRAADAFIESLRRHCSLLSVLPQMGRSRPDIGPAIRSFAHGRYVIFYMNDPAMDRVFILRIWSGRRRGPAPADLSND